MANSKFEYVKAFETPDTLLPDTWMVVRLDGRGFHKFCAAYGFQKPNDIQALNLMNESALAVMREFHDVVIAYGVSDEYSFIFQPSCRLFERRSSKVLSTLVSTFTSNYIHLWPTIFPSTPLHYPNLPTFDGRIVLYPRIDHIKDYLSWRQADCHINNLYNTTFHTLLQKGGMNGTEAELRLKGTVSKEKHEIMWEFGINYNDEKDIFKKGSVIYRDFSLASLAPNTMADHFLEGRNGEAERREETRREETEIGEDRNENGNEDGDCGERGIPVAVGGTASITSKKERGGGVIKEEKEHEEQGHPSKVRIVKEPVHQASASHGHGVAHLVSIAKRKTKMEKNEEKRRMKKARLVVEHVDVISEGFWKERPWILEPTTYR